MNLLEDLKAACSEDGLSPELEKLYNKVREQRTKQAERKARIPRHDVSADQEARNQEWMQRHERSLQQRLATLGQPTTIQINRTEVVCDCGSTTVAPADPARGWFTVCDLAGRALAGSDAEAVLARYQQGLEPNLKVQSTRTQTTVRVCPLCLK